MLSHRELSKQLAGHLQQATQLGAKGIVDQRLVAALLYRQFATPEEIGQLVEQAAQSGRNLQSFLASSELLSAQERLEVQALAAGLPFVDLDVVGIPQQVISLIRPETARLNHAVPIKLEQNQEDGTTTVWIALAKPTSSPARTALEQFFQAEGMRVAFVAAHPDKIDEIIKARLTVEIEDEEDTDSTPIEDLTNEVNLAPARQHFNNVIMDAVNLRASDIHLVVGPEGKDLYVRMRVDGVMNDHSVISEKHRSAVMAVFKIEMEGMDVSDTRRLQNGRFSKRVGGKEIDFRGATWLTVKGEEMVIRLLDKEGVKLDLKTMGMSEYNFKRFQDAYESSAGAIIICGPTGSGKSSTLNAVLKELITPERNILTIEDPVEYKLPGVRQAPVIPTLDRDFADTLRNALRCDPDVIMVGEIRDTETAEISMRAAISGHLLLSTVHAMEASAAPIQLIRMKTPAYQVADALRAVVGQRLARRLCSECFQPYTPTVEELMLMGCDQDTAQKILENLGSYRFSAPNPAGCSHCTRGYKGRIALHEILILTDEMRELILDERNRSAMAIRRLGVASGMKTLKIDGLEKAAQGLTSMQEVKRVVH